MGIDGQQPSCEMAQSSPQFPQSHLQSLGLLDGPRGQQVMDSHVGSQPRQAIDQLEPVLTQRPLLTHAGRTQGGFMHQLQSQSRFRSRRPVAGPTAEQVPRAQPKVFGNQQPQSDQIAGHLVS
jgi:hypothetical protein